MTTELLLRYNPSAKYEICIDEVGRGPLFGRVYVGAVILPVPLLPILDGIHIGEEDNITTDKGKKRGRKTKPISYTDIKDSKKFSSKSRIQQVSDFIKEKSQFWTIKYAESSVIDEINILQAVFKCMHECITELVAKIGEVDSDFNPRNDLQILVDGDKFKPYMWYDCEKQAIVELSAQTIEKGDATYMGIAAASIIAKVEHDSYIHNLCEKYPILNERYGLENNVGYGTKKHMDAIRENGITQWHRKSFAPCKGCPVSYIS